MRIAYLPLSPHIASARLRGLIPARELIKHGHDIVTHDADWMVLSKHGWDERHVVGKKILFDVCDDHFSGDKRDHYLRWCGTADRVTCNSEAMAGVIKTHTGRDAVVIPDPYESDEKPPKVGYPCLWFGHQSNLPDLMPWMGKFPLMVVSNYPADWVVDWSPENMRAAFEKTGLTVLPTGSRQAKSANRAIEAIRNGHFPVCGKLPAYRDLGLGCDDIEEGVHEAMDNRAQTLDLIDELQHRVRYEFSPERIGAMWADCFST